MAAARRMSSSARTSRYALSGWIGLGLGLGLGFEPCVVYALPSLPGLGLGLGLGLEVMPQGCGG